MYMVNGITAQFGAYVDFVFQEYALQLTGHIPANLDFISQSLIFLFINHWRV